MAEYPLILSYAARSHVGLVRAKNDDSAYAGEHLAVVADGMGGHAGGDVASASTVLDLVHLDHNRHNDDAGAHLADEIQTANSLLSELVHVNPKLAGMGTTVTALLLSGKRLAYAHIGDSRAYRLKNGVFEQLSTDHTFVQRMIDEGRMTEAEAEVHPHKNVLMRVLGDVDASPELDLKYFDAEPGERWLLCSDGLNFVRHQMIEEVIRHTKSLATAADTLIDLTLAAGSPDNVTVVVFDILESNPDQTQTAALDAVEVPAPHPHDAPLPHLTADPEKYDDESSLLEGPESFAVTRPGEELSLPGDLAEADEEYAPEALDSHIRAAAVRRELASRKHELVGAAVTANAEGRIPLLTRPPANRRAATVLTHKPTEQPTLVEDTEVSLPRIRQRPLVLAIVGFLATMAIVAGSWAAYAWTQTQYFVGVNSGNVAIFQGVSQSLGPISLSHLYRETEVKVSSLPAYSQQLVAATMPASTLSNAEQIISDLQLGTGTSLPPCEVLETAPAATPTATPTLGSNASANSKPTPSPSTSPNVTGTASTSASSAPATAAQPTCIPGGGK
ncbi:PP2C family protein-serine/threonine phosphatase [Arthrobacter psychrochitiniphilus]|uniref:PP2C family protein-serine/threonine phosphatase n=1 Tax=Arthrobacter psychrochitiniphilus TaxID=291045 RepID=UPI003F7B963D